MVSSLITTNHDGCKTKMYGWCVNDLCTPLQKMLLRSQWIKMHKAEFSSSLSHAVTLSSLCVPTGLKQF